MVNRPRNIGTAAESAVVRVLHANGFPHAERRQLRGNLDCGDVTGTPGVVWEVKGGTAARTASDGQVAAWLAETDRERLNAAADIGVLVVARKGIGAANAGRWWVVLPMWQAAWAARPNTWPQVAGADPTLRDRPVRLHLVDMCALLVATGYGSLTGERADQ